MKSAVYCNQELSENNCRNCFRQKPGNIVALRLPAIIGYPGEMGKFPAEFPAVLR